MCPVCPLQSLKLASLVFDLPEKRGAARQFMVVQFSFMGGCGYGQDDGRARSLVYNELLVAWWDYKLSLWRLTDSVPYRSACAVTDSAPRRAMLGRAVCLPACAWSAMLGRAAPSRVPSQAEPCHNPRTRHQRCEVGTWCVCFRCAVGGLWPSDICPQ